MYVKKACFSEGWKVENWNKNCVLLFDVFLTVHHSIELFHQPTLMHWLRADSALNQCTVQTFTESEDTRCCVNTIFPPEDGHVNARNMSRIIV